MKTCAYCGRENDDVAVRCRECGSAFVTIAAAVESPGDCERIAILANEVEAERLDLELENRQIPHLLASFVDSALDGLYQLGHGWGYVEAAPENREAVLSILRDIRQSAAEVESDIPPASRPAEAPAEPTIDPLHRKFCVSCRATIPDTVLICPNCGWTQPEST
jgi:hypothetical protein